MFSQKKSLCKAKFNQSSSIKKMKHSEFSVLSSISISYINFNEVESS